MMEPRNCGLVFMVFELVEDGVDDLLRAFCGVLVPVVGVDLVADDGVAALLDAHDGRGLVVGVGLFVDVVGRAEIERLHAEFAGEEALGELDLEVEPARWRFR